jgi:hypothetical protein
MELLAGRKKAFQSAHSFLAKELNVSDRQIRNFLSELSARGLVSWHRNKRDACSFSLGSHDPEFPEDRKNTSDQEGERDRKNTSDQEGIVNTRSKAQERNDTSAQSGSFLPEQYFRQQEEVTQEVFLRNDPPSSLREPASSSSETKKKKEKRKTSRFDFDDDERASAPKRAPSMIPWTNSWPA